MPGHGRKTPAERSKAAAREKRRELAVHILIETVSELLDSLDVCAESLSPDWLLIARITKARKALRRASRSRS